MVYFSIGCFIVVFIFLGIVIASGMSVAIKLRCYLHEHHHEKWEYLTSYKNTGPGLFNTPRMFAFLFDHDDFNDWEVKTLKIKYRTLFLYFAVGFISEIVFLLFIFFSIY